MTARRRARRETDFYRAVLALRRAGRRVHRVDHRHSRLNGRYLANAALVARARFLLCPPAQLELFNEEAR